MSSTPYGQDPDAHPAAPPDAPGRADPRGRLVAVRGEVSKAVVGQDAAVTGLVIATQNPVEYEGTYPLPEAQLDRFLLKLVLPVPERAQEVEVLSRHASGFDPRDLAGAGLGPVASGADLAAARAQVRTVGASPEVLGYIVDLVRATRSSPSVALGVSPRGATALLASARAWAWLGGRAFVTPDDVKALALPTLRHRITLRAEAEMEGVTTESVVNGVLRTVTVPR